MASLANDPGGKRRILFMLHGRRQIIYLGKCPAKLAESIKAKIEAIVACLASGLPLDSESARWVASLSDDMAGKLAHVGLITKRQTADLDGFLAAFIAGQDVEPSTKTACEQVRNRLVNFFGDRVLNTIDAPAADGFAAWMHRHYARATAGRTIKRAKQFFGAAVRAGIITANPFADVQGGGQANPDRGRFIDRPTIARVLDACPDDDWRRIVALARYGGLRCPSEISRLRWGDVRADRFWVTSPKTKRQGKPGRWVPLFPELRLYLCNTKCYGVTPVVTRRRGNWATQLTRIILRAGLEPWPRLFQNLRASRETELAAEYPLHVAAEWIGNTALVAARHYLTVREDDFARATSQISAQSPAAIDCQPLPTSTGNAAKPSTLSATAEESLPDNWPGRGHNSAHNGPDILQFPASRLAHNLADLVAALADLDAAQLASVAGFLSTLGRGSAAGGAA